MNFTSQRVCAYLGLVAAFCWIVGLVVFARWVPPVSPADTAEMVADRYASNVNSIRLGAIFVALGGVLYGAWTAAITVQMKRIEGRYSPMAYTQLAMGTAFTLVFIIPVVIWNAAAFRPYENIEITHRLNDLGWFMFLNPGLVVGLQGMAFAFAVLADKSRSPVFPRWLAYLNIFVMIDVQGAILNPFFKEGPFAWDGFFSWWVALPAFTIWMVTMSICLLRAIRNQEREFLAETGAENAPTTGGGPEAGPGEWQGAGPAALRAAK
ncbi:hypothetical protein BST36_23395 [Mycolicibacterium moriokaense]|uniref:DUF4386 domain-containing protein n=1 Tax=Mycolicibacterium moriokaense TaxID=39691 RepID=A0AAD1M5C5_9MYCO|nr:hypothetical protein [Mycolicibacterium moriokaense]MCV7039175.1 hypothetical protein [Mycolicibacterium moriokaense]ORB18541.1 hypothetical protein BST36_23395 [Mycolicibacterium moriokaense]BBX00079.1 hypothetical protein MMOR_10150 [Mycolicibacterium moriokaense]